MLHNPYKIVQMFEEEVAEYTGAPYAVSLDSCTNALFLCLKYIASKQWKDGMMHTPIRIPKKTYLSVPMSIIHAGGVPVFEDREWQGIYDLKPFPIWDAAKRFTSGMYIPGSYMCLSMHIKKHVKIGKGGFILCPDEESATWFKRARYEGRSEKMYHEDDIETLGWNFYMTPQQAAHGLALMQQMPPHNEDLPEGNGYRDLTEFTVFKKYL